MERQNVLTLNAYAKINLGLDVVGTRGDGYHRVKMVMQSVDLHDCVTLLRETEPGIRLSCDVSALPTDQSNLAYRAAALLRDEFNIPGGVAISLEKKIPLSAGLGGGSADGAAVLTGMNEMFGLGLTKEQLRTRALALGADVPFCLMGGTALAEGIGEILTRLPDVPPCLVLLAKPPFSLSTRSVYQQLKLDENTCHPDIDRLIEAVRGGDIRGMSICMGNVLENVAAEKHPEIKDLEKLILSDGADCAMMSGSGPTVFGFFDNLSQARQAAEDCGRYSPDSQIFITRLRCSC